ncbi:cation:proton antiporter family protein [Agaribacter marinus]|uniref:Potassium transporter Kef n=1 Tax=Agaribacter marinus TaxID=1431249 RepID=A0AA37WJF5_9ALTE|nr:cation:proton antiporter family protein [Agaribacter marinus]GLR70054.1 potassium transporter Kef [Agaribacter marinus]
MDFVLILIAFLCGLACKYIHLPPLVGFLAAGFVMNAFGFSSNDTIDTIANLGITVMLFTIGLKLNVADLIKREIWLGSIGHCIVWVVSLTGIITLFTIASLPYFSELSIQQAALIAFAFSFSSTVCVVKILEESGEGKTRHGKVAIGILVMQDIFAVLFLVFATGKMPSVYALSLFLLIPVAPIFKRLLKEVGHGELLPLCGFVFALGGYQLFELVGVKGDLGALVFGILLAGNSKSVELSKSLLSFKDLFLICFFLSIGLTALPNTDMVMTALLFTLLIPFKFMFFFTMFSKLRLRARTSFLTGAVMSNYSEFGLIVAALAVSLNMLTEEWLVIIAISVSFSFVITSIFYRKSHDIYHESNHLMHGFQHPTPLIEDMYPSFNKVEVVVLGMGRVGKGAFRALSAELGNAVCGMDADEDKVAKLKVKGLNAINGDGENIDLWESVDISNIKLVLLALPSIEDSGNVTNQLRNAGYKGQIAAIARYNDEVKPLQEKGVDHVFNFFTDAGLGFAEESMDILKQQQSKVLS